MNNPDDLSLVLDDMREQLAQDPNIGQIIQEVSSEVMEDSFPIELIEELVLMFYETMDDPEAYPQLREEVINSGVFDDDDIPPEFDAKYVSLMACVLDLVRDTMLSNGPQTFARGGLAQAGRNGDSMLAHINPIEARMLLRNGGSGTINPETGMREFGFFKKLKKVIKKIAKPILTIASVIPGPWQVPALALNAAYSASQGNWLGAALSAFGAYAAPGGFGGFTGTGGTAAGMGGSLGNGITGSLGTVGGEAAGMAGSLGGGISGGLGTAGSAAGGISGSLGGLGGSLAGAGSELAAGMVGGTGTTAMEGIGGLGDGISGSIAEYGASSPGLLPQLDTETMDMIKTGKNIYGAGKTAVNAYQMLNPPEPEEYSQQNTQRQMQQMGGLRMNTNSSFGLGGTNQRHAGQFSNLGMGARGFRNGGLARCTCKGN